MVIMILAKPYCGEKSRVDDLEGLSLAPSLTLSWWLPSLGLSFLICKAEQRHSLRFCCFMTLAFMIERLKPHTDVVLGSCCWSLYFWPGRPSKKGEREREDTKQVNWWGEGTCPPAICSCPAFLSCYSNQTNLGLKMRNPSPHTPSTSKLKTFYRLVNLQLRWCSKEQLWSNFDNDENNKHMARFRALLLQLQCSWIDKSD